MRFEIRHRDRQQRDRSLVTVIRERAAHQVLGDPSERPVAEVRAGNVRERVTARTSAKRSRAVIVRPASDLARSLAPMGSARSWSVGLNTRSIAGSRPSADCAPAEYGRRRAWICRGSRFQARYASLRPTAYPSNRCTIHESSEPVDRWC
jgi:hypothetical protein